MNIFKGQKYHLCMFCPLQIFFYFMVSDKFKLYLMAKKIMPTNWFTYQYLRWVNPNVSLWRKCHLNSGFQAINLMKSPWLLVKAIRWVCDRFQFDSKPLMLLEILIRHFAVFCVDIGILIVLYTRRTAYMNILILFGIPETEIIK